VVEFLGFLRSEVAMFLSGFTGRRRRFQPSAFLEFSQERLEAESPWHIARDFPVLERAERNPEMLGGVELGETFPLPPVLEEFPESGVVHWAKLRDKRRS